MAKDVPYIVARKTLRSTISGKPRFSRRVLIRLGRERHGDYIGRIQDMYNKWKQYDSKKPGQNGYYCIAPGIGMVASAPTVDDAAQKLWDWYLDFNRSNHILTP